MSLTGWTAATVYDAVKTENSEHWERWGTVAATSAIFGLIGAALIVAADGQERRETQKRPRRPVRTYGDIVRMSHIRDLQEAQRSLIKNVQWLRKQASKRDNAKTPTSQPVTEKK